jgi:hypothetical protein
MLHDVSDRDLRTYYTGTFIVLVPFDGPPIYGQVSVVEGGAFSVRTVSDLLVYHRDGIKEIYAPTLGYGVGSGGALYHATRSPLRSVSKGLSRQNTCLAVCPDSVAVGRSLGRISPHYASWALAQPNFKTHLTFAASISMLAKATVSCAVLSPRVALSLNATDATPGVWSTLWVDGLRVAGLDKKGRTVKGNAQLVAEVTSGKASG